MVDMDRENLFYVITKYGMDNQYLYSVEQCSFGKRLSWTTDVELALLFTSEPAADTFKTKNLPNVTVNVQIFLIGKFSYPEKI